MRFNGYFSKSESGVEKRTSLSIHKRNNNTKGNDIRNGSNSMC